MNMCYYIMIAGCSYANASLWIKLHPASGPETRAMIAVLPYIDELSPLHNIESFHSIITIEYRVFKTSF